MAEINLTAFVKKLQKRAKVPPKPIEKWVKIKDFDGEKVLLRSLSFEEIKIVETKPEEEQNGHAVYLASQTIRDLAAKLVEEETIKEPFEVIKLFKDTDVAKMAEIVFQLSKKFAEPTVEEIEEETKELKN